MLLGGFPSRFPIPVLVRLLAAERRRLNAMERWSLLDGDASLDEARAASRERQKERSRGACRGVFVTVGSGGGGDQDGVSPPVSRRLGGRFFPRGLLVALLGGGDDRYVELR